MSKVLREKKRHAHQAYGAWKSAEENGEPADAVARLKATYEEAEKAYFDETYEAELRDYEAATEPGINRHDAPREFWDLLEAAVATELVDPMSIYALATKHGDDLSAATLELSNIAHANRHDMRRIYYIVDVGDAADLKVEAGVKTASPELRQAAGVKGLKTQKEIIGHYVDRALGALK